MGWQAVKWGLLGWVDLSVELRRLRIVQAFGRVPPVVPAYQRLLVPWRLYGHCPWWTGMSWLSKGYQAGRRESRAGSMGVQESPN